MKRKIYTEEQIIGMLKEHEAGLSADEVVRKHGIAQHIPPLEIKVQWHGSFRGETLERAGSRECQTQKAIGRDDVG